MASGSQQETPTIRPAVDLEALVAEIVAPVVISDEANMQNFERIGREVSHMIQTVPEDVIELLQRTHGMKKDEKPKLYYLHHVATALGTSDDSTWQKLRAGMPTIENLLLDIILDGELCGFSKEELYANPQDQVIPYANYAYDLALLLNISMQHLSKLLESNDRSNELRNYAETVQRRASCIWQRLPLIMPLTEYGNNDFSHVSDLLHAYVTWYGDGWLGLHDSLYGTVPSHKEAIHHILYTFCYSRRELYRNESFFRLYTILNPLYMPIEKWQEICKDVFTSEETAQAFIDSCAAALTASKFRLASTAHPLAQQERPFQAILQFEQYVFACGPRILKSTASTIPNTDKIASSGIHACQRLKCQGDAGVEWALNCLSAAVNDLLKGSSTIVILEPHVACTTLMLVADVLEDLIHERCLERGVHIIDFVGACGMPGLQVLPDHVRGKARRGIMHLRHTIYVRYKTIIRDLRLSGLPLSATKDARETAELVIECIENNGGADERHRIRDQWGQCRFAGCACSGIKPSHKLRVCKGCWQVQYCSSYCQTLYARRSSSVSLLAQRRYRDWTKGDHRGFCKATRGD
ncbi:hypothetical protein NM688_g5058 [Phlebia brevispora]|uniref:Uncharacterized protein n=1 Tax=Phlebia brevispora TaxID=194682 RepID=A0ACC1T0X2_9APHY|nr:hypothetical protein NM688_g5058 [Phlebia brevispora]